MSDCILKTPNNIHKELSKRYELTYTKYDLYGPYDKYREENYKAYQKKCEEFKFKCETIKDENLIALKGRKTKIGASCIFPLEKEETEEKDEAIQEEELLSKGCSISVFYSPAPNENKSSETSVNTIRTVGETFRKRHERYFNTLQIKETIHCFFDPWFSKFLGLCQFISAVRKVITKTRMLKRLEILKKLTPEEIESYERKHISHVHLCYPEIFEKFNPK